GFHNRAFQSGVFGRDGTLDQLFVLNFLGDAGHLVFRIVMAFFGVGVLVDNRLVHGDKLGRMFAHGEANQFAIVSVSRFNPVLGGRSNQDLFRYRLVGGIERDQFVGLSA